MTTPSNIPETTETPCALALAIAAAGSQVALSRAIGVSQQRVSWWLNRSSGRVPAQFCQAIEDATGVSKNHLRPDVFGPLSAERRAA
jgi:DNA-binding transcriptional regulator YdaS (Cro superfamily)